MKRFPEALHARRAKTLILICILMGWCGVWAFFGSGMIMWYNDSLSHFSALAAFAFLFGSFCFAIVGGLWNARMWARRSVMALSVAMLIADVLVCCTVQDSLWDIRTLALIFPLLFTCLVLWYFSRPEVKISYLAR
jgi:peptidoglycan/LPS O-acetylase OafA/YrhL